MPARKTSSATKKQETARNEALARNGQKRHIASVVLFACGLLMVAFSLIGNADAETKNAWDAIHTFLRGVFGFSVFFIGPIMIYAAVMISRDKHKSSVMAKMVQLTVIVLLISSAVQIIFVGEVSGVVEMYSNGTRLSGGGVIGMILAFPLLYFGRVGASIIIVLIIFVFIMLIGNITIDAFFRFSAKPFKKAGDYAKQQREIHKQDAFYVEQARKKAISQENQARMKTAQRDIHDIQKEIEDDLKFDAIIAAGDFTDDDKSTYEPQFPFPDMPPPYITPENHESKHDNDEPPFDIPADDAFNCAVENFKEEEFKEELANRQREESFEESGQDNSDNPVSDFDSVIAMADIVEQYSLPSINLLDNTTKKRPESDIQAEMDSNAAKLIETLKSFGVITKLVGVVRGPSVTRYEIQPAPGVKISKITTLTDDIALNLAATGVRMEAPIPGKSAVGVEVPNATRDTVTFRELIDSNDFRRAGSILAAVIGRDITGEIIISDIAKMPHLLIAGTTGSGKSVCVNSIIMSILYRATPTEVRLMMIDPKMVEFAIYSGIPHLLTPVVTDPKKAAGALGWAVSEMTQRYTLFAENNVRNIGEYNDTAKKNDRLEPMAKIIIFIDELADLMMTAAREVEGNICRLAQLARAAGIHLVIATQRPTTNVVTGLIKANIPSRIGLKVASQIDSRVIFDTSGAEKLLGNGDMLYAPTGMPKPIRVQGCWVSNEEINRVVAFIKDKFELDYDENVMEEIERQALAVAEKNGKGDFDEDFDLNDDKLEDAIEAVIDAGKASTSYLQLKLKLGYGRAARLIDIMERMGVIGKSTGASRPREVLMTKQDWLERKLHQ
jgi:S-DNA-T family DNA segregation ATPase FtsK/SpoIIIE